MSCNTIDDFKGKGGADSSSFLFCTDLNEGILRTTPFEVVIIFSLRTEAAEEDDICEDELVCLLRGTDSVFGDTLLLELLAAVDVVFIDA